MAQTQTRPRGQSSSQQAPREAPRGNLPATQNGASRGRGQSSADRNNQALANLSGHMQRFSEEVEAWSRNLAEIGRSADDVQFFKEVLLTAVMEKPELLFADRRTFFNSARKCYLDGCLPDGRDAALAIYRTKIKTRDSEGVDVEVTIDAVQYMPMVRGIARKMLESGLVKVAFADAVYSNDHFRHIRGSHPSIEHEGPELGEDRGKLVGAYAVIKLTNGETLLDSMGEKEIFAAKAKSAGGGERSMLWQQFPWEAYKKTVFRRLAKSAPVSPNIKRLVDREDEIEDGEVDDRGVMRSASPRFEYPIYAATTHEAEPEPEPQRQSSTESQQSDIELTFDIVNLDGEVIPFTSAFRAFDAVVAILSESKHLGVARLDGFWEGNQDLLDALSASEHANLTGELAQRYSDARDAAEIAEREAAAKAADQAARKRQIEEEEKRRQAAAKAATAKEPTAGTEIAPTAEQPPAGAPGTPPGEERPFPGDLPNASDRRHDRPADMPDAIVVPLKAGKNDYRTFAMALIRPKIRSAKSTRELALLLGANEASLTQCRAPGTLDKDDLATLESDIKNAYDKLAAAGV